MLKKVLECRNTLNEFYQNVWNTIIADFPKSANNVQLGNVYKDGPINAELKMSITVYGEQLQVTIVFSKVEKGLGQVSKITVDGFGEIPILTRSYLPINGF